MAELSTPREGTRNPFLNIMFLLSVGRKDGVQVFRSEHIVQGCPFAVNHRSLTLLVDDFTHFDCFVGQRAHEVLHLIPLVRFGLVDRNAPL